MDEKIDFKKIVTIARQQGKVLPVTEAFKRYPVEDEDHKGKLEYWTEGSVANEV